MPIKGHLEPPRQAGEERQYQRRNLLLETSGGSLSGEQANVTIHNISASGLLVETTLQLDEGYHGILGKSSQNQLRSPRGVKRRSNPSNPH